MTCKCAHSHSHSSECVECGSYTLSRNHYFTGKLLVDRDFEDEQSYFVGKHRRHNQYLHGWGVVCGLKVKQHPDPNCRDDYVVIEPGYAIDCCGNEIFVPREEYFDFRARVMEKLRERGVNDFENYRKSHTLQICIRYRECPSEPVPAILDECSTDADACQPNRILQGYDVDVLLDPVRTHPGHWGGRAERVGTLEVTNAHDVAFGRAHSFILSSDDPAKLYVHRQPTQERLNIHTLPQRGHEVVASIDGRHVYVALADGKVQVLDATALAVGDDPLVNELNAADVAAGPAHSLVVGARTGRLYQAVGHHLIAWNPAVTDPDTDPAGARDGVVDLGEPISDVSLGPDEAHVYAALAERGLIKHLPAGDLTLVGTWEVPTLKPHVLEMLPTTDVVQFVAVDSERNRIGLFQVGDTGPVLAGDPDDDENDRTYRFTEKPVAAVLSGSARFTYVTTQAATGEGSLVLVDNRRLSEDAAAAGLATVDIGANPGLVRATDDGRLFVPHRGVTDDDGDVAIFETSDMNCGDLFWESLEGCPQCEIANCVVLATIDDYSLGHRLNDPRIDNISDRRLLPSTSTIVDVIRCILEDGVGGRGPRGPAGPTGPAGPQGETGPEGPAGPSGLNPDLAHICGINWPHGGSIPTADLSNQGLRIAFDRPIHPDDIHAHSLRVLRVTREKDQACWCEVAGRWDAGHFKVPCKTDTTFGVADGPDVKFIMGARFLPLEGRFRPGYYRVVVQGDFIREIKIEEPAPGEYVYKPGKALDANHLPPWLPKSERTGDGIEGGTFESWFEVTRR